MFPSRYSSFTLLKERKATTMRLLRVLITRLLAIVSPERLLSSELKRCGEVVDPHLHIAPWFNTSAGLLAEFDAANISMGLLYNPYPKMQVPFDMNTYTHGIAAESEGRIYALASLNTTHDVWEDHREFEMDRLATFLAKEEVLGTKLAPPHTCLPLVSSAVSDVVETVSKAKKSKVIAIHIGTTPFCGPLGKQFNITTCCGRDYVDPTLLLPKIKAHPDITFILLHSGHEFLPTDSPYYYNFEFVDASIALAKEYDNVWISISAMFAQNADGTFRYPGGHDNVKKMKKANILSKMFWGSDASYFQGQIRNNLIASIKSMVRAGYTEEERCWAINGAAREAFGIPAKKECTASTATD